MNESILEQWPVERLVAYEKNPRQNDHAVDQIAEAIHAFGFRVPVVAKSCGLIVDGHLRLKAAKKLGLKTVPVLLADDMTENEVKAFRISVNKMAELADWDFDILRAELLELDAAGFDLKPTGFSLGDVDIVGLSEPEPEEEPADLEEEPAPELPKVAATQPGDVWLLGDHRVMCGDSAEPEQVAKLTQGAVAPLLHADPPYGMGKESDGVLNDNLTGSTLDAFQMAWWRAWRPYVMDAGAAYIWGNPADLWRWWYVGGLQASERLTLKNEIVWSKPDCPGLRSGEMRSYPVNTERCLFFTFGEQSMTPNAGEYWEGYEPVRQYMNEQREISGFTNAQINDLCNKTNVTQSAFTRGGFRLLLEEDYNALRLATGGKAFARPYHELKQEYDALRAKHSAERGYFDNTHDSMTEVWQFSRVQGEERHGHATPKPVAMVARAIKSSAPEGAICLEPFGGSGSTLMAAESTGRVCYTMELDPRYCDVIVKRWQKATGKQAEHEATGEAFNSRGAEQ